MRLLGGRRSIWLLSQLSKDGEIIFHPIAPVIVLICKLTGDLFFLIRIKRRDFKCAFIEKWIFSAVRNPKESDKYSACES